MTNQLIDLHLHLDGAITTDIIGKLARIQQTALPSEDPAELKKLLTVPENCTSLNDFLKCFALPVSFMQTYEGLREAAFLVAEDMRKQGVVYGEIRYAPQLHLTRGLSQIETAEAVLEGLKRSTLKTNLILCCMRGDGNDELNRETVRVAEKLLTEDGGVVALDLAGAEALFPTERYAELFGQIRKKDIPFTIHAGEAAGAESVRLALQYGAKRIGHGVRASEDEALLDELCEKGIGLEMCPTSNRQTMAVTDMSRYPFMEYLKKGICVTVNTDDPAIEGTTLEKEYRYMEERFGLTAVQKKKTLLNAIETAFTGPKVKKELKRIIEG